MDNLGVWIYIIFILIAVISTYRKAKKQINTASRPLTPAIEPIEEANESTYTGHSNTRNDSFLESFTDRAGQTGTGQSRNKKNSTLKTDKAFETEDIYLEQNIHDLQDGNYFEDVSDLRKAVITSEILTRKF